MKKIESSSLAQAVYDRIRSMIVEGDLVPGSRLNKKVIAETLAVSLTPVNDAVRRLEGERLVVQAGKEGYVVRSYTDKDLADIYVLRAGIESIAARLCALEASDEDLARITSFFRSYELPVPPSRTHEYLEEDKAFHGSILAVAGVPLLVDMDGFYGYMIKSYGKGLMRAPSETLQEHRQIIAALAARNGKLASELMTTHHLVSRQRLLERKAASD